MCTLVAQDYVNKLTHLLLAADGQEGGPAHKQIRELVEAQRWAVRCFVRNDMPKLMRVSLDIRRDGGSSPTSLRTLETSRRVLVSAEAHELKLIIMSFWVNVSEEE